MRNVEMVNAAMLTTHWQMPRKRKAIVNLVMNLMRAALRRWNVYHQKDVIVVENALMIISVMNTARKNFHFH